MVRAGGGELTRGRVIGSRHAWCTGVTGSRCQGPWGCTSAVCQTHTRGTACGRASQDPGHHAQTSTLFDPVLAPADDQAVMDRAASAVRSPPDACVSSYPLLQLLTAVQGTLCPPHQEPTMGAELTAPLVYGRGRQGGRSVDVLPFWRGVKRFSKGSAQYLLGLGEHVESLHAWRLL
jgi:hypothetical protein